MKVYAKASKNAFIVISVITFIICIITTIQMCLVIYKTSDYVKTKATVIEEYYKDRESYKIYDENDSSYSIWYKVQYNIGNNNYENERLKYVLSLKKNSKITVYYNSSDPTQLRPALEPYILIILLSVLFFSLCIIFIVKSKG